MLRLIRLLAPVLLVIAASVAATPWNMAATYSAATGDVAANEALVRRYYDLVNADRLDALPEVLAPDFAIRTAPPNEDPGLVGLRQNLAVARVGLPDFAFSVDDLIVDGDLVVARTTISGTHLDTFFGSPPTGREITTTAHDLWRVADGKLAEVWHVEDILGVMQQLGAVPDDGGTRSPQPVAPETAPAPEPGRGAASGSAGTEELARRFLADIFEEGDPAAVGELFAPNFVWHWHAAAAPGGEGLAAYAAGVRAAFPDLRLTPAEVVAEGDRVAILWTLSGTQQGEFLGLPATGRRVAVAGIDIHRFEDGRIAESWSVRDDVGLLAQLGAFDGAEGAAATPAA